MSTARAACFVFLMLWGTYVFVHQLPGPNQMSRLSLLHALWNQGTLVTDRYQTNAVDVALHKGHHYSEKAPGISLLALPPFFLAATVISVLGISVDSSFGWLVTDWAATALSVGLITAAGGAALFVFLAERVSRKAALLTTLALFLGAMPFPYATVLFSHGAAAGMLCCALWCLTRRGRQRGRMELLAGFLCGLTAASEFTAAPACIALFLFSCARGRQSALRFAFASIFPLLLIPAYNWAAFGSPFIFGYHHSPNFAFIHRQGLFGIVFPPDPQKILFLLVSPARGLFAWTPFLLLSLTGYSIFYARRFPRSLFFLCLLTPVAQCILIASFLSWGGDSLGPRYLASILPFLALPAALECARFPRMGAMLAAASIFFTATASLISATPPLKHAFPIAEYYIPLLLQGAVAPNLGSALGLPRIAGAALLVLLIAGVSRLLWKRWANSP